MPVQEEYRGSDSHVQIPSGVQGIGVQAFSRCECVERSLVSSTLPADLQAIEHNAFENCLMLEQISLPDTLMFIGDDAFAGCDKLREKPQPFGIAAAGDGFKINLGVLEDYTGTDAHLVIPDGVSNMVFL